MVRKGAVVCTLNRPDTEGTHGQEQDDSGHEARVVAPAADRLANVHDGVDKRQIDADLR